MVDTTLLMISKMDPEAFSSNMVKEYYEVIRELMSIILLLNGYKTKGGGSHKALIYDIVKNFPEISDSNAIFIDDLRKIRNRIAYDGFFVPPDYVKRNKEKIMGIIEKLRGIIGTYYLN